MLQKILHTNQSISTIFVRLLVGTVFLSEGIQKFMFPETLGAARFIHIGIPFPEFMALFVGFFEILCGIMVLVGLMTRLASVPLFIIILVAILTTKVELLASQGFWKMLHESRTDWSMLLGTIFLFIEGGGKWSVDNWLSKIWLKRNRI